MQYGDSMFRENDITLNCLEVLLNRRTLSLHKARYSQELYEEYLTNPDFFIYKFYEDDENESDLYIWKLCSTNQEVPNVFEKKEITINKHSWIFRKIVESYIVQLFRDNDYNIFQKDYSNIWEVELKYEESKRFRALLMRPTMTFTIGNLYSMRLNKPVIVLSVRRRMKRIFVEDDTTTNHLSKIHGLDLYADEKIIPSTKNQYRYLESIGQKQEFDKYRKKYESPHEQYEFFMKQTENFNKVKSLLFLPDGLKILDFSLLNLPNNHFNALSFRPSQYFYYNERTQAGKPYQIVPMLRPFSYDKFSNLEQNILVVFSNKYKSSVDKFINTLEVKLRTLFHLKNINFDLKVVNHPETYIDVLDMIDCNNYDLAIIVISKEDKTETLSQSLYHSTKAKLLNQRLLSQELTIEKIQENNEYINANIALNVYSKLGGIPWTVEKTSKDIPELIIGIGSTVDDSKERVIGFASVFDYNGTYIVGDCSQLSVMNDYAKNLEDYLVRILTDAFKIKGLSRRDQVRLTFHLFKEAGRKHELTAIENALNHFKGNNVRFSLVHLSYYHNFLIYKNQGKIDPNRGTIIPLSSQQVLLHLGKNSFVPIQVRIDKRSEYGDIFDITQQVLHFAHLSYRSFFHVGRPVTVKYPSLMAKMVSELKDVPNWDYSITNKLNRKLWFI